MAKWEATETRKISLEVTDKKEDFVAGVVAVYLVSDTDCYVDFDRVATTSSFLVKANQFYHMELVHFTQLHAIGTSGNLFICVARG